MNAKTPARLAVLVAVAAIGWPAVQAWGPQGHRLVALVAANHLAPLARQNIAWLLDGRSLADVSIWADQYLEGNYQTALWHYVNLPLDGGQYDRDRDCPRQPGVAAGSRNDRWRDCVVERIPYHQERLANGALDRPDRAIALKFLVHFVGDLHQPFHALGLERGGNGILVSVFGSPTCGGSAVAPIPCNLHHVWDSALIARRQQDDASYAAALHALIVKENLAARPVGTPADWASQSLALSKAALLPQQGNVDEAYYRAQIPVVDERLALAGLRLAAMLNAALTAAPPGK